MRIAGGAMEKVLIKPSGANGSVTMPPSKSAAHRAIVCSFLAGGGTVSPIIDSKDMLAALGAVKSLQNNEKTINCIESGNTLRFFIPVAAALGKSVTFTGEGRLPQRPIGEYLKLLPLHGVEVKSAGALPLSLSGRLQSGDFHIRGDISSQYITGLLLALPVLSGDSRIILTSKLLSRPYVELTLGVLRDYGVEACETDYGYFVPGNQKYAVRDYTVEGDWSHAAFFMSAAAIGGSVTIKGLRSDSRQGDMAVCDVMRRFGAQVAWNGSAVTCRAEKLSGIDIDCEDITDMAPAIAVTAAFAKGRTVIRGASRLRLKESDRLAAIAHNLRLMGAAVDEREDGLVIDPPAEVRGAELRGFNDHRIVMAFSVAGMYAKGETVIDDAGSIAKTYPAFFDDFRAVGGRADVFNAG